MMRIARLLSLLLAANLAVAQSSAVAPGAASDEKPSAISMLFWTSAQKERWFREVEAVTPTRLVPRGEDVRPLPVSTHQIEPTWKMDGGRWTIEKYMDAYRVSGLIVLRDGKILLERYGLDRKPTDRWTSFSVAKSITSLLAGAAIEDGKLRLEDVVEKFIPEMKGSAYEGVTLRQLLMMSSGVRWTEEYTDRNSDVVKFRNFASPNGDPLTGYLATLPRRHAPGKTFNYNTAETDLAGFIISRAVGQTLSDYLSEKIWKPYGMEADALWMIDRQGRELAGCCLSMTLRDYARVGQFVLENGAIDGKAVVPAWWIEQSTTAQISNGRPAPAGYGYFWWIGERAFEASGIFGQSILIYPKERLVIVQNAAWDRPIGDDLFRALSMFQGATHDAAAPEFPKTMRE